jgi:tellurite methyltransferase
MIRFLISSILILNIFDFLLIKNAIGRENNLLVQQNFQGNRGAIDANRFESLSGVKVSSTTVAVEEDWDQKFNTKRYIYGKVPSKFLAENFFHLPAGGKILDVGMSEGRNSVFLAQKGFNVTGIDISAVAVEKARKLANEYGVRISTVVKSVKEYTVSKSELYDGIICLYFVDRNILNLLEKWLKPGGILIFGSYTTNQLNVSDFDGRNHKKEYFLRPQELLKLFPTMIVVKYEEPLNDKSKFEAHIILQKKK